MEDLETMLKMLEDTVQLKNDMIDKLKKDLKSRDVKIKDLITQVNVFEDKFHAMNDMHDDFERQIKDILKQQELGSIHDSNLGINCHCSSCLLMKIKSVIDKPIRIDCYLALLNKYKAEYPEAHFEIITRPAKSELAPSKDLLIEAGIFKKPDGSKNPKMEFKKYIRLFIKEIMNNPKALKKLKELRSINLNKAIFLVCYETNPLECHRSIIKRILEKPELIDFYEKTSDKKMEQVIEKK